MDYENQARAALVQYIREAVAADTKPSPRGRLHDLALQLDAAADAVLFSADVSRLAAHHDRLICGAHLDGSPRDEPANATTLVDTVCAIRQLATSASEIADKSPAPRQRFAVREAVLGYLHLAYERGDQVPSLYDEGKAIKELDAICRDGGLVRSRDTLRKELAEALRHFDGGETPSWWPRR